jgi:hypothetical protein
MIFSVLFSAVGIIVLIVFLLDRAAEGLLGRLEAGVTRVGHWLVDAVEGITATPVRTQAVQPLFGRRQPTE